LTRTEDSNELYPHVSPDGTKILFLADEGEGDAKSRNIYVMGIDGSGRTLIAKNGRDPCWKADGTAIAYMRGEFDKFTYTDYASKGIVIYDLATKEHRDHPNKTIHHLYNLCWTPDGKWFIATVHAGMNFKHAILAIEANGMGVHELHIGGCRPDVSSDGKMIAWGASDWHLRVGRLDFTGSEPKVVDQRDVATSEKPIKIYHIDWSPDGKYVTFSRGPTEKKLGPACEMIGVEADGWDICVADAAAKNRVIELTSDGKSNKEPDWAPAGKGAR